MIAISTPDSVFEAADELADRLGLSRSALYAQAVLEFLERHRSDSVTEKLNEIYGENPSGMDPVLHRMQLASLPSEEW